MTSDDTNCLIAAVIEGHEPCGPTRAHMRNTAQCGEPIVLVTHCLVEAFANLSAGRGGLARRSPADTIAVLEQLTRALHAGLADCDANAFEAMRVVQRSG